MYNVTHFQFQLTIIKHCGFGPDYIRPDTYSMLSRYNGIGSIKLSIAAATHNRRTSNVYTNDFTKTMQHHHQMDTIDSTYAEIPSECTPALSDEHHDDLNHVQRANKLNQTTTTTATTTTSLSIPQSHSRKTNDLSSISERISLSQISLTSRQKSDANHNTNELKTIADGSGNQGCKLKCIQKMTSTNSIYSTSTISNSSLQEYDDDELDTAELAKYMRQINKEINHDAQQ